MAEDKKYFDVVNELRRVKPYADIDGLKFFSSIQEGLEKTRGLRLEGKSFYVIENGKRVEYVFEGGIEDSNLVRVTTPSGGEGGGIEDLASIAGEGLEVGTDGKLKVNVSGTLTPEQAQKLEELGDLDFNKFLKESENEEITVKSKNLINYEDFESATYAINSASKKITKSSSTSWISVVVSGGFEDGETYCLQGIGNITNDSVNIVIFANNQDVEITSITKANFNGSFVIPTGTAKIYLRIANGTNVGVDPTNSPYKNTVQLAKGTLPSDFEPYGYKPITLPAVRYVKTTDLVELSDVYITYLPENYQGSEEIIFYTRRSTTNYYIGFFVRHEIDTSEIVYSNQFRITKANEYLFEDNQMKLVAENVIFGGESECVYQQADSGKVDFTGGVHGDEQLITWDLLIDGVPQVKDVEFRLKPCKTASYIQKSTMHETANSGGVVIEGHPIQAIHYKNTMFMNSGYETHNALEWKVAIPFYWYHGICCVGKYSASEAYSESLIKTPMTGSLETYFNLTESEAQSQGSANGWSADKILQKMQMKKARKVEYWNSTNNKGVVVESWLDSDYLKDDETLLFVHDRANDSKYYRRTLTTNSVVGSIDRSIMRVFFK